MTGDRREVTEKETDLLRATGTTDLLSVSGLHVGMVALFVAGIVWLPSRILGLWSGSWMRAVPGFVAAIGSVAFALFVGNPAPAARAAWMASAGAVLRSRGRRVDAWNLLGLAVLVTCCSDPGVTGTLSFHVMPDRPWVQNAPSTVGLVEHMVPSDCMAGNPLECVNRAS